jgi:BON domain
MGKKLAQRYVSENLAAKGVTMSRHKGKFAVLLVSGLLLLGSGRLAAMPQESNATSDSAITSSIQSKLFQDPVLKTQDIRVSTQQGVVTLTGTVETQLQQAAVDRIASTEPGVVKVVDGLNVGGSASDANSDSAQVQYSAPEQPAAQDSYPNADAPQGQSVPSTLVLPAGTLLTVRLTQELSSDHNRPGDNFTATLDQPLVANGWVVMRHGQTVIGRVAAARKGGRVKGVSELGLELNQITLVDGQQLPVRTQLVQATAGSSKGRDAGAVGTTTGVGAIIGAIAGGGEGAGIGAAAGAAAGVAGVLLTHGRPTVLMPETLLTFRLESPLNVSTAQSQPAFRAVNQQDYPQNELQHRPDRFPVTAPRYGYYAPAPYWGYYGWGPYYPYYFGLGYYSGWGYRGRGYYRSPRYYRAYRGHGDRGGRRGRR